MDQFSLRADGGQMKGPQQKRGMSQNVQKEMFELLVKPFLKQLQKKNNCPR